MTVKGVRRKELLPLDDEFAKEVSDLETLEALRERIHEDLQKEAEQEADHQVRHELLQNARRPAVGRRPTRWSSRKSIAASRSSSGG